MVNGFQFIHVGVVRVTLIYVVRKQMGAKVSNSMQ
jgi:hypothetical protein